jgi:hypothetical protein
MIMLMLRPKDRNNLGNARVMGMQADLHLTDEQFFNCLMMFCKWHLLIIDQNLL